MAALDLTQITNTIGHLATEASRPESVLHRVLCADLASASGLHPSTILPMMQGFSRGYGISRCRLAVRRMHPERSQPVGTVAVVAPANLPVAAWQAVIEPLLAGNNVRVRPSDRDRRAVDNFVAALRMVDRSLADCIEVMPLQHGDRAGWQRFLHGAGCLAIHGSDAAVAAVLALAGSLGYTGRVRSHGSRQSLAVLDGDTWRRAPGRWATGLARDALVADGRGCMSLRLVVWLGLAPSALAEAHRVLAAALQRQAQQWPAGRRDGALVAQLDYLASALQTAAVLRPPAADGGPPLRFDNRSDGWLASSTAPAWLDEVWPGPGHRCLIATACADLATLTAACRISPAWSTLAWAGPRQVGDQVQRALGAPRRCAIGDMHAPRADRDADGYALGEGMRMALGA